ncbi:hypothetical protein LINGRAHAP2_LOCUS6274 [Linum grandiflorum]
MSATTGSKSSRARGDGRFYVPPCHRKSPAPQPEQHEEQPQQHEEQPQQQQRSKHQPRNSSHQRQQQKQTPMNGSAPEIDKRTDADQCPSSSSSSTVSNCSAVPDQPIPQVVCSNLDRFLAYTTPAVPAQHLPKTSVKEWRHGGELHQHPYFVLGDLWESFGEWSAFGVGVPLLLNGSESIIQYYVPYLSGIQLYKDPSKQSTRLRRTGEDSDTESSRETSSDGSSEFGTDGGTTNGPGGLWSQQNGNVASIPSLNGLTLRHMPSRGSSSDEGESSSSPSELVFEYMERASPFTRQPLADQISELASQFPELRTLKSCELSDASWMSVAWYPIYRIPVGQTLQNLDACFLTFHLLSTTLPTQGRNTDGLQLHSSSIKEVQCADSSKLLLYSFGLASYKLKVSFWNPDGSQDCPKASSLLRTAETWLRLLEVNHPDYTFFSSHNSGWR